MRKRNCAHTPKRYRNAVSNMRNYLNSIYNSTEKDGESGTPSRPEFECPEAEGTYAPYGVACSSTYFACTDFVAVKRTCAQDLMFDATLHRCLPVDQIEGGCSECKLNND